MHALGHHSASTRARRSRTSPARRALLALLILTVLVIAWAGLRPAADYSSSWVTIDEAAGSFRFENYGLAYGQVAPSISRASMVPDFRIDFSLPFREASDNRFQVIAQLGSPGTHTPLLIGLWHTSIIAMNSRDFANKRNLPRVSANLAEHVGTTVRITITFGENETRIDANGRFAARGAPFSFATPLTRITLGNSPDGEHGWEGTLESFDIVAGADALPSTSYAFATASARRIDDRGDASHPLAVPMPGHFPDRAHIGRMGLRQLFEQNLRDVVLNFLGFAPLGFAITGLLRMRRRPVGRVASALVAMIMGTMATVGIETAQLYIPGRSSHVHDLALNASGTVAGALGFLLLAAALRAWFGRGRAAPSADAAASEG